MPEENFMNIKTSKTMDQLFCSPDGRSWNLQDSEVNITDRHNIISVPVRRYTHIYDEYTILACTYMCSPMKIFYQLAVKCPNDVLFSATPDKDARILKRLLERAPISVGHYIEIEQILLRKFADQRRREFLEKMKMKYYGATINGNTLAETIERERNNMEVSLFAQQQETVKYNSHSLRLVATDEDIKIIQLLLQVAKENVNIEETLLEHEGTFVVRPHGIKQLAHPVDFCIKVQIPGPLLMSASILQGTGTTADIAHRMRITDVQDENSTRMPVSVKDDTPISDLRANVPTVVGVNDQNVLKTLLDDYNDANNMKIVLADDDDAKCKKIVIADGDDEKCKKIVLADDDDEKCKKIVLADDDDEKCKKIVIDDDDDDHCFGIMGVYCNSSMHTEYKGGVSSVDKAIG